MTSENASASITQNRKFAGGWDVEVGEASMARKGLSGRKASMR